MLYRSIACGLLVAALAAACGGGAPVTGSPASTPTSGTTSAPPAVSGTPSATLTPAVTPTATSTTSGTVDACALVSAAEVSAALGGAVTIDDISDANSCFFVGPDGTAVASVIYLPEGGLAFPSWKAASDSVPVPGLGDDAVFNPQTGLIVLVGGATVSISVPRIDDEQQAITITTQLIQLALSRL